MKITALIAAGGRGTRMGAPVSKVFLDLMGRRVICRTVDAFEKNDNIDEIILVTGADDVALCREIAAKERFKKITDVVAGGRSRQESVHNGLCAVHGDIVLIHDGARALVTGDVIDSVIGDCIHYGAAAAGVKCKDTLKSADDGGFITGTVNRETTYLIQTPQAFYTKQILALHEKAAAEVFEATDDCMIAEKYGVKVKISSGSYDNIKLTTPIDIAVAKEILTDRRDG